MTKSVYNAARSRPALAESGIFSTPTTALRPPTSDLRTGTQFPVSSIRYQVSYTYNSRFTYSWDAENRLPSVSSLDPQSPPSSAVKIESTYDAENRLLSSFTNSSNPSNPSDPLNQYFFDFRFSSEFLDQETGLVYYNYRHYSPQLGRWTGRDPVEEKGGRNLYGMVRNDTTNSTDFLGQYTTKKCNVEIFLGHYAKIPDDIKCENAAAGSVVCCWSAGNGEKKCKKVENPIPGATDPNDPLKELKISLHEAIKAATKDFEAGVKHAAEICKLKDKNEKPCCESVTVSVNCDGLSDFDKGEGFWGWLLGGAASDICKKKEDVKCP